MKRTVVFDFDGVINSYKSGWKGATEIPDPPVPGIKEAIDKISEKYYVVVVSSRCSQPGGTEAIAQYLEKYGISVENIVAEKPPELCYVDDRAIRFDGNADILPELVEDYQTWYEKEPTVADRLRNSTREELARILMEKGEIVSWRLGQDGLYCTFYASHKQKELILDWIDKTTQLGMKVNVEENANE